MPRRTPLALPASQPRSTTRERLLVGAVAAVSLVIAFAVAQGTGVRWLGAVILVAGGVWCAVVMVRAVGILRMGVLAIVYVAAFVVSHPLGNVIGSWPAVFAVAAVTGATAYAAMGPGASRVSTTSPPTTSTR